MKTQQELRTQLKEIDHKSYSLYKSLAGEYQFADYVLSIDKVQADPFASPSRVRVRVPKSVHGFSQHLYENTWSRLALEDTILRKWNRIIQKNNQKAGSGNSGRLGVCGCGQEILERQAVVITKDEIQGFFLIGFPAKGRSILARELEKILFEFVPEMVKEVFLQASYSQGDLQAKKELAENQQYIRDQLKEKKLVAFLANGSVLPRESGVSQRPMKHATPFQSPASLEVTMDVPYGEAIKGMGIPQGVTVIVGGGYHGKSTLLEAMQLGVYNHIAGDGREYVIADDTALKIRAEDGRNIEKTDIHMFINHLPNEKDTERFSTENASGSTSQAANMIEAMEAGAHTFFIDEDTSATNFMVRDGVMQRIVAKDKEPITPFISWVRALYEEKGISTVIVVGSSAAYLEVADTILQLDFYEVKDIKKQAKEVLEQYPAMCTEELQGVPEIKNTRCPKKIDMSYKGRDMKVKTSGTDTILFNKEAVDVRYLEQLIDHGQTVGIAYLMKYAMERLVDGKKTLQEIIEEIYKQIEQKGIQLVFPKGYSAGFPVMPRKQEVFAAWNRFRKLEVNDRGTVSKHK